MLVVKRDASEELVSFDKITARISQLCYGLSAVDPVLVAQKVVAGIYNRVQTSALDDLAAETAAYMTITHPQYSRLAARISVSNLHKMTSDRMDVIFPFLNECTIEFIKKHDDEIHSALNFQRDFEYDYFGVKTLMKSYLLRDHKSGKLVERIQTMLMRVSCGIHAPKNDLKRCLETYELLSMKYFTHATPTMFNAGTPFPQLASCFLLTMIEDSIEGIFDTLKRCALISKYAGGIGISVSNIRAKGSVIRGTNGTSNGLTPLARVYDAVARYVDQGGGRRKGSIAFYMEPHHADIYDFLELKRNTGKEELRARDLFYALWISDLFMKRVEADETWSLFCPNDCPDLVDLWGEAYEARYKEYETRGLARKQIRAQDLWKVILESQVETGTPYILYKDAVNRKSNHQHLGTIRCSNLCTEIVEFSSANEVAVCNLASIALPKCVEDDKFNYNKLREIVHVVTYNLNSVIDANFYPVPEARRSNMMHRPIGIGVQGLADVFIMLKLPFASEQAKDINKLIFETIYFAALEASCALSKQDGPYDSWENSPTHKGILQFDMWNVTPSEMWDWNTLRDDIRRHGLRNSLLVAPMPTASTAQILGNNECFEPYTSNIYNRRVLAGEFAVVNNHLIHELELRNLWTPEVRRRIIQNNGSVQSIEEIPSEVRELFKTTWELKMRDVIDMAADRGAFIDQSQSMNLFLRDPSKAKLGSMHMYTWKKGLKTGMYYLRTQAAADAIQVTVCSRTDAECTSCSA